MVPTDAGAVLYAFTLGLVAALNPCGFPMLPAYLALFAGRSPGGRPGAGPARIARGLQAGACVSAGFMTVFGVLGALLEGGARLATDWLPCVMAAIGLVMAGAGIFTLLGRAPALRLPTPRFRAGRSALAMAGYGVAYATGSLSCSLPLFLAAVAGSFTGRGFPGGLCTYLAYALGMALFVTAAAVVTSTLGAAALRKAGAAGRWLPAISGITLTLSGAYLAYYWLAELLDPADSSPVTLAVARVQGWLTSGIGEHPLASATVLVAVVLGAIGVIIRRTLTHPQDRPNPGPPTTTPEPGKATNP